MDADQACEAVVGWHRRAASEDVCHAHHVEERKLCRVPRSVEADDFNVFKKHMKPVERQYARVSVPFKKRVLRKAKQLVKAMLPASAVKNIKNLMGGGRS